MSTLQLKWGLGCITLLVWIAVPVSAQYRGSTQHRGSQYQATARLNARLAPPENDATDSKTSITTEVQPQALPSTEEVVTQAPGLTLQRGGGFGRFSGLSLRGTEGNQALILIGDIPLDIDENAPDLSTFRLWLFERIDVYRGGLPLWYNAAPIGGALRLVPRRALRNGGALRFGAGSFGLRQGDLAATIRAREWSLSSAVGIMHADNDFSYLDGGGTAFDTADDTQRKRQNADVNEGYGLMLLRREARDQSFELLGMGFGRRAGEPGPAIQPTRYSRRAQARFFGVGRYEWHSVRRAFNHSPLWRVQMLGSAGYQRAYFRDNYNELGLGVRINDDDVFRGRVRLSASSWVLSWLQLTGVVDWSQARFEPRNLLAETQTDKSSRYQLGSGFEALLSSPVGRGVWELRPSVRFDHLYARLADIRPNTLNNTSETSYGAPTFRLAGAYQPVRAVSLRASVSRGTRFPTLREFFGDRGFVSGNTELKAERSDALDASIVIQGKLAGLQGHVEARAFSLWIDDMIRYQLTLPRFEAIPENIDRARIRGMELGQQVTLDRTFHWVSSATFLYSEDPAVDRSLPLRPQVQFYLRPTFMLARLHRPLDALRFYFDVLHIGSVFVDRSNLIRLPSQTRLGAGASLETWHRRATWALSVYDLFNNRGFDLLGFPLPGRHAMLSLTLQLEETPKRSGL